MTASTVTSTKTSSGSFAEPSTRRQDVGALVIGGDHPGLAIARSLGQRGIPVIVIDDRHSISVYSRYVKHVVKAKDLRDPQKTVESVLEIGRRYDLRDWVLFPTRDETVMAFSLFRERLAEFFRVTTPAWESTRHVWDKKNTYRLAEQIGIPAPKTWSVHCREELSEFDTKLPLAIKPSIKENFFYATGAKAWRADTPERLRELFDAAARNINVGEIMIQEIIPGDGECQISYCSFFRDGQSHSSLTAKRLRQHPREFGRAATYVETADIPEVAELAQRFLRAINFYGIAEIEFKRDPRDGQYKILDVNARTWGFLALGRAVGVDFTSLLFEDQVGRYVAPCTGRPGVGWLRLLTDTPVAAIEILRGHLSLRSYIQSLRRMRTEAVFTWSDPLPFVAEFALLPYFVTKKLM
jgi:D-aspartate ligase